MKKKINLTIKILILISYVVIGSYYSLKLEKYFEQFDFYLDLANYYKQLGNQSSYLLFLNSYFINKKISILIRVSFYFFASVIAGLLFKPKNNVKKFQSYPKIMSDLKLLDTWNYIGILFFIFYVLIFLNFDFELNMMIQHVMYLSIFFMICITMVFIIQRKTNYVLKRMKNIAKNDFKEVSNEEFEDVVNEEHKRKLYPLIRYSMIIFILFLCMFTFYQYKTYYIARTPEIFILTEDLKLTNQYSKQKMNFCNDFHCYSTYDTEILLSQYQLTQIQITIHDDVILERLKTGQYHLIIKDDFGKYHLTNENLDHNQFTWHDELQNQPFNWVIIEMIENDSELQLNSESIDLEITLIQR